MRTKWGSPQPCAQVTNRKIKMIGCQLTSLAAILPYKNKEPRHHSAAKQREIETAFFHELADPYRGGAILVWCWMRDRLYVPSSVPVSREITLCLFSRRCRSWLSCPLVRWGSISSKDSRTEFGSSRQRAINSADKPGPIACLMIPGSMKENSPTTHRIFVASVG